VRYRTKFVLWCAKYRRRIAAAAVVLALTAGGATASAATAAIPAAADPCPAHAAAVGIRGSTLCLVVQEPRPPVERRALEVWVERSARIVADYYGRFPAPMVMIRVESTPGAGVHGGRTTREPGLLIRVSVGQGITPDQLAADWILVHEMVHLALPELGPGHDWLAEGLATYVEGIARAQFGNRDIRDVWAEYRHSMPMGLPRAGEGGMDQTPTWGRTYWGGALYCLRADVAIREQTGNRVGLQTALRAILQQTGGYAVLRNIDDVLRIGDAATGTRVLQDLYGQIKTTAQTPDLDQLWSRLGVPMDPKSEPFDAAAPLAPIRVAITTPMSGQP
jgi:hypothetical protein